MHNYNIKLRPYQSEGIDQIARNFSMGYRRQVFQLPTGAGKCHAKGTKILLYDGSIKLVEDILVGDQLMGPDSKPRNVLSLARGKETMYEVIPIKGESFVVNESHVLSLRYTGTNQIRNISIRDYLNLSNNQKHILKGYRVGVEFEHRDVDFDPYVLGIWLAEGTHNKPTITNPDHEVIDYLSEYCQCLPNMFIRFENLDNINCLNIHFVSKQSNGCKGGSNTFLNYLRQYGLISNRHVPEKYKINSKEVRLQVLAGLLDGDGHLSHNGYEIITKSEKLKDDILFLSRSLGLAAYSTYTKKTNTTTGISGWYYRIGISGNTDMIPCKIERKKATPRLQKKDVLNFGFQLKKLPEDNYYGFELDGDHLYLLSDFTVTHNTITFAALIARYLEKFPKSIVVCVHREELLDQTRKTLYNGFGIDSEAIKAGRKHIPQSRVYVAMVETINNMLKNRPIWAAHIGCLVVDEVHIANFNKLYDYFDKSLIIGFTATPIAASKKDPLKNYYDQIVVGPQIEELIDMGSLCENITYGIKGIDTKKFGVKRGEFDNEVMGSEFSKSKNVQNCVDKYLEKGEGKKAIVFNCNVVHSKLVTQAFVDAGLNAKHLDGSEPKETRKKIFEWFSNEDDAILNNIAVATTGFDEPSIRNVVVNRSTMSLPLFLQMCVDMETEILTNDGFKKCDDIQVGDIVASYNIDNAISYEPCLNKIERFINKDECFYSIKSPQLDFRVTNQHKLLCKKKKSLVYELMDAELAAKNTSSYKVPISGKSEKKGIDLTDDQIRFIGWFISDGTLNRKTKGVRIYQSLAQPEYLHKSIEDCIKGCGFKYGKNEHKRTGLLSKYKNVIGYTVSSGKPRGTDKHLTGYSEIAEYLDKNIHPYLMSMNARQLGVFLETLNYGDGVKRKNAYWNVLTKTITAGSNKVFADRMQILCIENGYKCNISTHYYNKSLLYNLQIREKDFAAIKGSGEKDGNRLLKENITNFAEKVWCVETVNKTIITRRNGKVVIMGNCGRGSRPYPGKEYFNIIDLGGNTKLHLDWRTFRNWNYIFHHPDEPRESGGVAPVKTCEKCEAMIAAQSVFCKYCGHEHVRVINYDQINIELEMIIGRIDVARKHKENTDKGHKDFKTFFDILNQTFAILKSHGEQLPNDLYREQQFNKFQEKVKEWCKVANRPFGVWMKNFAKEQFDKKYLENKKLYA